MKNKFFLLSLIAIFAACSKTQDATKSQEISINQNVSPTTTEETPPPPPPLMEPAKAMEKKPMDKTGTKSDSISKVPDRENYAIIHDNPFYATANAPLSTFSIDVDRASYSNIRRFINQGQKPPKDAVRIEEMINYFEYDYPQPTDDKPFSINTEVAECKWNSKHKVLMIGLQGKKMDMEKIPPANLVFLLDVSGSMNEPDKLPLLISSLKLLTNNLREEDKVSIVVYAGAAGLVLPATSGSNKAKINKALEKLEAGGSTAGGEGIILAYKIAKENYIKNGNNRIILATDGDFNVGASSDRAMEDLITEKRKEGIFLTCLGFGSGNYQDSKMETLADKGNGNYAYIDNIQEARKTLVTEMGGTLFTIAKDVKLQIEFNPTKVKAYRLIGYENRMLNTEDFKDDKKDAGELGAGHTVTALYEIIPVGIEDEFTKESTTLKYQQTKPNVTAQVSGELATVKFRYKKPDADVSKEIVQPIMDKQMVFLQTSENYRFANAVALFGMLLRESKYAGNGNLKMVSEMGSTALSKDPEGYRAEFLRLVKSVN